MILQTLKAYNDRLAKDGADDFPVFGFSRQKIHFCLVLDREGNLVPPYVMDLRISQGNRRAPVELIVPEPVKRTVGIASNFLWDNTGYGLGLDGKGKPKRASQMFEAFKKLQRTIGVELDDEGMTAVLRFLDRWNPADVSSLPNWEELVGLNLVFRLDGKHGYIHERPRVRNAWLKYRAGNSGSKVGTCLVTGAESTIARLHPAIKGVVGAQSSGAALVSFNLDAFTSYGKTQNFNAPIGEEAAFAYSTALNWLLRDGSRQKIRIGDTTVVFWAERKSPAETLLAGLLDPEIVTPELGSDELPLRNLHSILEAARSDLIAKTIDEPDVPFYILGLSPNASRLSVRFWHVSTAGDVLEKVGRHFRDMRIQASFDSDPEYPSVWRLVRETATQGKIENVSPLLAGTLLHSILTGGPYPQNLLSSILMRIRADRSINYLRTAITKACLIRNYNQKGLGMSLDNKNTNIGYRLGRLFAILERVQTAANPGINSTIRDKYFGSASATPRNVFPMLLNLAHLHLGKLRRGSEKKGLARYFDTKLEEIVTVLPVKALPAFLQPVNQGLFVIGYYHQRQDLFGTKPENKQEE